MSEKKDSESFIERISKTDKCNNPKHRWAFFVYNLLGVVYLITMFIMVPYLRKVDIKIANCCYYAQEFCSGCFCHGYSNKTQTTTTEVFRNVSLFGNVIP